MKPLRKTLIYLSILPILSLPSVVFAQSRLAQLGTSTGFAKKASLSVLIASYIKVFIGITGVLLLLMLLYAGFLYMIAAGEEDKVNKAKKVIANSIIGLVLIVSSYAIADFVESNIKNPNTNTPGGSVAGDVGGAPPTIEDSGTYNTGGSQPQPTRLDILANATNQKNRCLAEKETLLEQKAECDHDDQSEDPECTTEKNTTRDNEIIQKETCITEQQSIIDRNTVSVEDALGDAGSGSAADVLTEIDVCDPESSNYDEDNVDCNEDDDLDYGFWGN